MSFFKGFVDEISKYAFHEGWGAGGEWSSYQGVAEADGTPLMHERGVPYDVEMKSDRRDFFHDKQRGALGDHDETPREPNVGGKIVPGKLGKYYGTGC